MLYKKLNLVLLFLFVTVISVSAADTARLQVIHNAADPAAAVVDIYLNDDLLLDDFAFRAATPYIDAPAGEEINIGVAPGNSSSSADALATIPLTLMAGETYVAVANGVLDPSQFAENPEGASTAFQLLIKTGAKEMGMQDDMVDFFVLHGATDAPAVDVIARNVATLVDNAPYPAMTDYISVPAGMYLLDVTPAEANDVIVATFKADLSGLGGGAAVVFASGFLTPDDDMDGEGFGILAALPDGSVVSLPLLTTARLQVIHNAADPAAAVVDIYLNDDLLLDDFAFRAATPYIDAPAGEEINIGVAPGNSSSSADALATIPLTLMAGETYVAVANGVLDPSQFAENPEGASTAFQLLIKTGAKEMGMQDDMVDFFVLHGATDAPAVDVIARDVATLVDNAPYSAMTDYISVPAGMYLLDVTPAEANDVIVATFKADLSGLGGGAAVVFASGFLTPNDNMDGENFGIWAALPNGVVVAFPSVSHSTSVEGETATPLEFSLEQNYPNPFNPTTTIQYSLSQAGSVRMTIYNTLGSEVATLVDEYKESGSYNIRWNGISNMGVQVSSGLYYYKLETEGATLTRAMMLLK